MGLITAALSGVTSVLSDQWKEYFICDSMPDDILAVKGRKKRNGIASAPNDNIITNGSGIVVADGQCVLITQQGKVVDYCAEPGRYTYDISTEPSMFDGGVLSDRARDVFDNMVKRFTYGGVAPQDQRVYYFNTKEIKGNKYGTPNPVPFRVVDERAGLDIDISLSCFGEYSYKITNPLLFYANVCGNMSSYYSKDELDGQMRTELLTALQPAFAKLSEQGIRYSSIPAHTFELADALNEVLSSKWRDLRGIEIVSFGISSLKA
ncbi:MAG: SPFH domain-containing protein, partial [Firmicutes bacterium]|nr:SPFH domain-containing protein [Bacillota bacterium]